MRTNKSIHFNGLNGIRAICALAVVLSHALSSLSLVIPGHEGSIFVLAGFGVTAFFALSGFLITYLLVEEKNKNGGISIKKFYIRRLLRIWPLYFGYMLLAIPADIFIFHITDFSSIGYYLLFFPNIPTAYEMASMTKVVPIYLLGHFWSLGVEEQFYAIYPWLVKVFKSLFKILCSMLAIVLVIKLLAKLISYKNGNLFWYSWADNTRFDAMAIGGFGAWFLKNRSEMVNKVIAQKSLQLFVILVLGLIMINKLKIPTTLAHTLIALVTVLCIYYSHLLSKPFINLRSKPFDFLGKISFGMYVYHPLVIAFAILFLKSVELPEDLKIITFLTFVLLFTLLIAMFSYKYVENYFLKAKARFTIIKSSDGEPVSVLPLDISFATAGPSVVNN